MPAGRKASRRRFRRGCIRSCRTPWCQGRCWAALRSCGPHDLLSALCLWRTATRIRDTGLHSQNAIDASTRPPSAGVFPTLVYPRYPPESRRFGSIVDSVRCGVEAGMRLKPRGFLFCANTPASPWQSICNPRYRATLDLTHNYSSRSTAVSHKHFTQSNVFRNPTTRGFPPRISNSSGVGCSET